MSIAIHHDPDCGTSRNALAVIEASGETMVVIEYLETGWTCPQLLAPFAAADLPPRTALRPTKSPAEDLGLLDPSVRAGAILAAMLDHPIVVVLPWSSPRWQHHAAVARKIHLSRLFRFPEPPLSSTGGDSTTAKFVAPDGVQESPPCLTFCFSESTL